MRAEPATKKAAKPPDCAASRLESRLYSAHQGQESEAGKYKGNAAEVQDEQNKGARQGAPPAAAVDAVQGDHRVDKSSGSRQRRQPG